MTFASIHRWPPILLIALIGLVPARPWQAQPNNGSTSPTARKVARIELARSIRAFATSTLANGDCLVSRGRLSRSQENQAMGIALREMGISPAVLSNPQVLKAAGLLLSDLDENCSLNNLDQDKALKLVTDEL